MVAPAGQTLAEFGSTIDPKSLVRSLGPGDKQIVAIARAVATDAQIVILDEPTSSLTAERVEALFAIARTAKCWSTASRTSTAPRAARSVAR